MHCACLESISVDSEFKRIEFLPNENLTIDTIDTSSVLSSLKKIVENRAADAASSVAEMLLQDSALMGKSFKMVSIIASKIGFVSLEHYFRSGRSYIGINHNKGILGNIFFKAAFDNLFGVGKYHLVEQENRLCIICRA